MTPFLAMITPLTQGAHPEHPIALPPQQPPRPPSDAHPEHPIVIPPDAIAPGVPTHPIYIPVYPAHPIVIPPEAIAPGVPTHPIILPPPHPEHPIVLPPDSIGPGVPDHPIELPPSAAPPGYDWKQQFVPATEAHWEWTLVPEPPHVEHYRK